MKIIRSNDRNNTYEKKIGAFSALAIYSSLLSSSLGD